MPKVKHPTVRGVEREVPKGDLDAWLEQGWVEKGARRKPAEPEPDTPKTPRSATTRQQ